MSGAPAPSPSSNAPGPASLAKGARVEQRESLPPRTQPLVSKEAQYDSDHP